MSKVDELKTQVEALQKLLTLHGITEAAQKPIEDPMPWGSPAHAAFLGVVIVAEAGEEISEDDRRDFVLFTSRETGVTYRLEDEITTFAQYPDPTKAARLVLRQKVSNLESPVGQVPADAPPMWRPADMPI